MESECLRVEKKSAEKIRRELLRRNILNLDLRVKGTGDRIFLPLKETGDRSGLEDFGMLEKTDFEPVEKPPRTYRDLLSLPPGLQEQLPSSFDIIGDICILKLTDDLLSHKEDIGKAILETKRGLKTVAIDRGVKGEFRIRDLEVIAGQEDLETTHVENNLRFRLDPSRVYFSPRLSTERMRIARQTEGGKVLDMFAGVGSFSLTIGRHGRPDEVIGIDLNPDCIEYFSTNIRLNSLEDKVEAYLGDAGEAPLGMGPFDRVVMNLPHGALDFLDTALYLVEEGFIHIYSIIDQENVMSYLKEVLDKGSSSDRKLEPSGIREVHNYSPSQSMMVLDLKVTSLP
jgi:tRNA (guanine37-N1)-methyltransferase